MHSLIDTHNFSLSFAAKKIGGGADVETKKVPVSQHRVFFFSHFSSFCHSAIMLSRLWIVSRVSGLFYLQFQKKISYCLLKLTLLSLSWCIMKNIICRKSGNLWSDFLCFFFLHAIVFKVFFFQFLSRLIPSSLNSAKS